MKKRILIIVYALLLCVTSSFAWLSNFEANQAKHVTVDFQNGNATVVDPGYDAYITTEQNGEDVRVGDKFVFDHKKMVPNSVTPFKIKIKNKSETESKKAKLSLAIKISPEEASKVNILDVLYVDIVVGQGFDGANTYHVFKKLSEATLIGSKNSGEYILDIYGNGEEIVIPPTSEENEYVSLNCYIYYDKNATAEYQDKTIQTLSFRLE